MLFFLNIYPKEIQIMVKCLTCNNFITFLKQLLIVENCKTSNILPLRNSLNWNKKSSVSHYTRGIGWHGAMLIYSPPPNSFLKPRGTELLSVLDERTFYWSQLLNIVMLNVFVPFMGEFSDPSSPSPLMAVALNPYELLPYFVGDKCPWAIHIFHIVQ